MLSRDRNCCCCSHSHNIVPQVAEWDLSTVAHTRYQSPFKKIHTAENENVEVNPPYIVLSVSLKTHFQPI